MLKNVETIYTFESNDMYIEKYYESGACKSNTCVSHACLFIGKLVIFLS